MYELFVFFGWFFFVLVNIERKGILYCFSVLTSVSDNDWTVCIVLFRRVLEFPNRNGLREAIYCTQSDTTDIDKSCTPSAGI